MGRCIHVNCWSVGDACGMHPNEARVECEHYTPEPVHEPERDSSAATPDSMDAVTRGLKLAYRKHCLDDSNVGWGEVEDALCDSLCEAMGDAEFQRWLAEQRP